MSVRNQGQFAFFYAYQYRGRGGQQMANKFNNMMGRTMRNLFGGGRGRGNCLPCFGGGPRRGRGAGRGRGRGRGGGLKRILEQLIQKLIQMIGCC